MVWTTHWCIYCVLSVQLHYLLEKYFVFEFKSCPFCLIELLNALINISLHVELGNFWLLENTAPCRYKDTWYVFICGCHNFLWSPQPTRNIFRFHCFIIIQIHFFFFIQIHFHIHRPLCVFEIDRINQTNWKPAQTGQLSVSIRHHIQQGYWSVILWG